MVTTDAHESAPAAVVTGRGTKKARNRFSPGNHRIAVGRVVVLVLSLAAWDLISRYLVDPFWIPSPMSVGERVWGWASTGILWDAMLATAYATFLGFIIGATFGAAAGLVLGRNIYVATVLEPFIAGVYALPKVALAPLFILWFGLGLSSKVVLSAAIVFFLVFYNTYAGVRSVDRELVNMLKLVGANERQILFRVICPSASRWVFAGLRIAAPYALGGAVVGEMIASNRGLGYLLRAASGNFDTAGSFGALFVTMVVAMVINYVISATEKRIIRWDRTPIGAL